MSGVPIERSDRGQAQVAASRAVAPLLFYLIQEGADQGWIQICQSQLGRRFMHALLDKLQQQSERVAVRGDRVRADTALSDQALREETLQQAREPILILHA
jgi:hypothetical protein